MTRELRIMGGVLEHYEESLTYFPEDRIIGIFLQGSQNYGLDYEKSDIDTKLIIAPTFKEIAFNRPAISTTFVRQNEEHTDRKDVRLYMQTFRKQNLNFLEILFTDFKIVNPLYEEDWNRLIDAREAIAHFNPYRAIKSMKGIAMEKYHAMEHPYPSKAAVLAEYLYDPKQLHHLLRVEDCIERYIKGESYESCLRPTDREYLLAVKRGLYDLEDARRISKASIERTIAMCDDFTAKVEDKEDKQVDELLNEVQYSIMEKAIRRELL